MKFLTLALFGVVMLPHSGMAQRSTHCVVERSTSGHVIRRHCRKVRRSHRDEFLIYPGGPYGRNPFQI